MRENTRLLRSYTTRLPSLVTHLPLLRAHTTTTTTTTIITTPPPPPSLSRSSQPNNRPSVKSLRLPLPAPLSFYRFSPVPNVRAFRWPTVSRLFLSPNRLRGTDLQIPFYRDVVSRRESLKIRILRDGMLEKNKEE